MSTETVRRKLAAILTADVKGYSRLMGDDEEATISTLTAYRRIIFDVIANHHGRVVDWPGDNLLAEFSSVVDAVRSAVEVQREIGARNAELPEHRKMEFRIGVNLGDVIADGERIYGDGVNIASRLESMAEAGGVCISGPVYDQVKHKLDLTYDYLGEQQVKNIADPVRIYRAREPVRGGGGELGVTVGEKKTAPVGTPKVPDALPPEEQSLAVLPFTNMSGDAEQEYFSDGITEDIITDLSKISGLFVVARNTVFTYKGKAVKVQDVGRELGVRHVLEGSVRKAGNRVRIAAQLIDAVKGGHLWAERYDRDLGDVFALQDEITGEIVSALKVKLTKKEEERLAHKDTENLAAYECYLRGLEQMRLTRQETNLEARRLFEKAVELDGSYAQAYVRLGWTHLLEFRHAWNLDPECLERARQLAQNAITIDEALPGAYCLLAEVHLWSKEHDEAIAKGKKAIVLDPNYADAYFILSRTFNFSGLPEQAKEMAEKAIRLNPQFPGFALYEIGRSFYSRGEYEKSIEFLKWALVHNPDYLSTHIGLTICYHRLGRREEARQQVREIRRIAPGISIEFLKRAVPYKHPEVLDGYLESLRASGLS